MEIIHALKSYTSPDNADLLFKTLVETSQTIDQKNKDSTEVENEEKKEADRSSAEPSVSYEDQLQLLLDNLNKNEKLNPIKAKVAAAPHSKRATNSQGHAAAQPEEVVRQQVYQASNTMNSSQLMTQAYHLINEVIMHPQIMWTRNFFYSLGAMV